MVLADRVAAAWRTVKAVRPALARCRLRFRLVTLPPNVPEADDRKVRYNNHLKFQLVGLLAGARISVRGHHEYRRKLQPYRNHHRGGQAENLEKGCRLLVPGKFHRVVRLRKLFVSCNGAGAGFLPGRRQNGFYHDGVRRVRAGISGASDRRYFLGEHG